jgi:hypothetical protein
MTNPPAQLSKCTERKNNCTLSTAQLSFIRSQKLSIACTRICTPTATGAATVSAPAPSPIVGIDSVHKVTVSHLLSPASM